MHCVIANHITHVLWSSVPMPCSSVWIILKTCSVKTFTHSIPLWMVQSGMWLTNCTHPTQFKEDMGFKIKILVWEDPLGCITCVQNSLAVATVNCSQVGSMVTKQTQTPKHSNTPSMFQPLSKSLFSVFSWHLTPLLSYIGYKIECADKLQENRCFKYRVCILCICSCICIVDFYLSVSTRKIHNSFWWVRSKEWMKSPEEIALWSGPLGMQTLYDS